MSTRLVMPTGRYVRRSRVLNRTLGWSRRRSSAPDGRPTRPHRESIRADHPREKCSTTDLDDDPGRRASLAGVDREAQLPLALDRCPYQADEQWVRPGRAGAELGMGLGGHIVGMRRRGEIGELEQI